MRVTDTSLMCYPSRMTVTYASMFSCAGIGDYGFHQAGAVCQATQELEDKRMYFQRLNGLCDRDDGYVTGDITDDVVYAEFIAQARGVDMLMATPPCQGMSVSNRKRGDERVRNSLVTRAISAVSDVAPTAFIFENVPAFLRTTCTGLDGTNRPIGEEIDRVLGNGYAIASATVNLNRHGSPSSRTRSITIGTRRGTGIDPAALAPPRTDTPTLRDVIGRMPPLHEMGEVSEDDVLHGFRPYGPRMRPWIAGLAEGASAFDNHDPLLRPHRVIDGAVVPNKRGAADKYKRLVWDSPAPCIHTRNDTFSSQNTVHPTDDRVLSIREVSLLMGLDDDYRWFPADMSRGEIIAALPKRASLIRRCLGEAVPASVTRAIGENLVRELG